MQNRGSNKHRDGWVEINLEHLEHNIKTVKSILPQGVRTLAVVKADAYGHGSVMCAPTLIACGVDMFGVASIDEGVELRENKINIPVLVLGTVPIWSFETAIKNNIAISIFNKEHLYVAKDLYERTGKKLHVHIKIDTGMNRIGVRCENAIEFIKEVQGADYVSLDGVFTHFADVENKDIYEAQLSNFKNIINNINSSNLIIHCANSPATIDKDCYFNMVRLGIVLYGLTPFGQGRKVDDIKQVIALKGRITNIHEIKEGEGVSYGHTFKANKTVKVATIPIGYADGVARSLSNKISGSLNDHKVNQIGNITMDQMMFDITGVDAEIGDIITLLGKDEKGNFYSIDEWAQILNTINYELTCRLKVRLPRIYTREE